MKNIILLTLAILLLLTTSVASGEIGWDKTRSMNTNKYSTAEEFLEAEWNVCIKATDGINIITVKNWEFWISTFAYIETPEYSCINYKLSDNDMSFYNTVKNRIDLNYVQKVDKAIVQYETRMKMLRWSDERRIEAHEQLIERVETMISDSLIKYPQDIALPKKANNKYLKITLIKFELMLLDM